MKGRSREGQIVKMTRRIEAGKKKKKKSQQKKRIQSSQLFLHETTHGRLMVDGFRSDAAAAARENV